MTILKMYTSFSYNVHSGKTFTPVSRITELLTPNLTSVARNLQQTNNWGLPILPHPTIQICTNIQNKDLKVGTISHFINSHGKKTQIYWFNVYMQISAKNVDGFNYVDMQINLHVYVLSVM